MHVLAREALDRITDGFIAFDPEWRFAYLNPVAAATLGRTAEDLSGKVLWEEFPELEASSFGQLYRKAMAQGSPAELEDYYAPFGRWFFARAYPSATGLSLLFLDVTERKTAELALEQSERRLNTILESVPECVKVLGPAGELLSMNRAGLSMVEAASPEEVIGECIYSFIGEEHRDEFKQLNESVFDGEEGGTLEFSLSGLKGTRRTLETQVVPLRSDGSTVVGALSITRDVTERKRTEAALRESDDRMSALVEATSAVIWNTSAEGQFVKPQPSWEQYTGQKWPEYANMGGLKAVHPEDRDRVSDAWKESVSTLSRFEVESRLWHAPTGEFRRTICRALPILNPDGSVREWAGAYEDIEERMRAEDALREGEHKLLRATRIAQVGVWEIELPSWHVHASAITNRLFGFSKEPDIAIEDYLGRLHPDDQHAVLTAFRVAAESGAAFRLEYRINLPDSKIAWHATQGEAIFNESGRPVRLAGATVDITRYKQAEESVRISGSRFRRIFDSAGVSIWDQDFSLVKAWLDSLRQQGIHDLTGYLAEHPERLQEAVDLVRVRDVNAATLRLFGAQDKDRLLSSLAGVFLPETLNVFKDELVTIWEGRERLETETVVRTITGEPRNVLLTLELPVDDPSLSTVLVSLMDITPLKRADALVRRSEERQRRAVEAGRVGLWEWDIPNDRVTWSDHVYRLHGLPSGTFRGTVAHFADLIHPADKDRVAAVLQRALAGESEYRAEYRPVRPDGEAVWIQTHGQVIFDEDGKPVQMHGSAINITDRKRAELRDSFLVELDDLTRPLTDAGEIVAVAARSLGEYLEVNRCAYADVEDDENTFNLIGDYNNGVPSIVGRYTFDQFGDECLRLMREGEPYIVEDSETDARTAPVIGSYRMTRIRSVICVPLFKAGLFVAGMAVHQVTPRSWRSDEVDLLVTVANRCWESIERTRVARELRESETRLRLAQRAGRIGTFEWMMKEGRVVWTPELEALYGVPEGTFEGSLQDWVKRVVPEDAQRVIAEIEKCLASHQVEYGYEFRAVLPSGIEKWLRGQAQFSYDGAGEPVRMIGVNIDVDDRKRAERELQETNDRLLEVNRELEEFAYVASHDLQEPLRMVNIYTEMLLRRHVNEEEDDSARKYANFVRSGVHRMEQLIHDLLSYSRIIHTERAAPGAADLGSALYDALAVLQDRMRETGATINYSVLPLVMGDEAQLAQVFQNLLSNALKYRNPHHPPEIEVSAEPIGNEWIIAVRDRGLGFEQKYAEHIFGLFKRLYKDEYPGTGLGLAICKRIVERSGGRMWAEGRSGQGATFYFALPAVEVN